MKNRKNQDQEIQSKCNTKLEISFKKRIKNWEIKKKIVFLSIYKIFWFWYKNTRRFTFSGSKQFRLSYKNIKMFHKKDIVCKLITTESVIAPKPFYFVIDKCHTDAIFFDFLKGFYWKNFFSKIITTEPVIAPKLDFFVEEFPTDSILLFFFDLLKGFYWKDCFR